MPLHVALLLSLCLHAALVAGSALLTLRARPADNPRIEARLIPPAASAALVEAVSTDADSIDTAVAPHLVGPPRPMQGSALHRAQAALSKHLFYPPEAVAQGLEGEVILLLTLSDHGQLLSAAIARSSGHALLDQAALEAAKRIGALPGNPRQTLFPVSFRLR